jgi:hypothetical protein
MAYTYVRRGVEREPPTNCGGKARRWRRHAERSEGRLSGIFALENRRPRASDSQAKGDDGQAKSLRPASSYVVVVTREL